MSAWISRKTAEIFATQNFAPCGVHRYEAVAMHRALQRLCENDLRDLKPGKLVSEILPAPTTFSAPLLYSHCRVDSLDRIELAIAIEEEQGSITDSDMDSFLNDLKRTQQVFDAVLGPVASTSTWDPATIWFRSISSIVNERVRYRGGCTCG